MMQLELSYDGEKSKVQMNYNYYSVGKKRPYTLTWTVYDREDSISTFDFYYCTPCKYQKHKNTNPIRPQKHVYKQICTQDRNRRMVRK
jgi:hypothetical protein